MRKVLDLGYGNPAVLQKELIPLTIIAEPEKAPYFFAKNPIDSLKKTIYKLHSEHGNVSIQDKSQIVITVGAVQAIQACLYFYSKKGFKKVYIPKPFWGRFKDFTDLLGFEIVDKPSEDSISLITSPNNPNGASQAHLKADIRDACYNWTHYTDRVEKFNDRFVLFSLSKLSGHSSSRIGWVVCQSVEDSRIVQDFVNIFTSGVSIEAQMIATKAIETIPNMIFSKWKKAIQTRKDLLNMIILTKSLPMKTESSDGMFWYGTADIDFIRSLDIIFVEGADSFDPQSGKVRLNLAVSDEVWEEFISRL